MAWRRLRLTIDADALAECESLLELAGASSIAIRDAGDAPLLEPAPGQTPLWPVVEVDALFETDANLDAVAALMREAIGPETVVRADEIGDEWRRAWRQRVEARRFGERIELVPADERLGARPAALRLHMGLAFGTGEHPTTALCLEWLDTLVEPGMDVLDYGCGSGVLALAALKLGARYAYAVDNDAQALEATKANAELNGIGTLWLGAPESLPDVETDLVIANILLGPLEGLAESFSRYSKSGGLIALSGILESQAALIERAYAPYFEGFEHRTRNGWALIAARRRAATG